MMRALSVHGSTWQEPQGRRDFALLGARRLGWDDFSCCTIALCGHHSKSGHAVRYESGGGHMVWTMRTIRIHPWGRITCTPDEKGVSKPVTKVNRAGSKLLSR